MCDTRLAYGNENKKEKKRKEEDPTIVWHNLISIHLLFFVIVIVVVVIVVILCTLYFVPLTIASRDFVHFTPIEYITSNHLLY